MFVDYYIDNGKVKHKWNSIDSSVLNSIVAISPSYNRPLALKSDGSVVVFGSNGVDEEKVASDGKTIEVAQIPVGLNLGASSIVKSIEPEQAGTVDLIVAITKPVAVTVNKKATYKLTVTNNSEFAATGVKAYFVIPGKTLVTVDVPKNCTANGRIVECSLADLAAKKNATQSFSMTVWKKGALNVAATTTSVEDDVNLDNNEASAVISVK